MNRRLLTIAIGALALLPTLGFAENAPGVTATEIKIGQPLAYSGPAAAYSVMGKAELAYFKMVNEHGGVHGRKITLLSVGDGFNPAKTVEVTRRLVEQDKVAFIYGALGSMNLVIRQDVADVYRDAKFPWTVGAPTITYFRDGFLCAQYILKHKPDGKIAVLYLDDPNGREFLNGFIKGLGSHADMIVKTLTFQATDPTVDSQVIELQATGADVFMNGTAGRQAPMAIRKTYDIGWHPMEIIPYVSASISATLLPAGAERSTGVLSHGTFKEPADPQWRNDQDVKDYLAWMNKYYPQPDPKNLFIIFGHWSAKLIVQMMEQCGDDLSRENILKQAASVRDPGDLMLLPNLLFSADPRTAQMRVIRFDGKKWELLSD